MNYFSLKTSIIVFCLLLTAYCLLFAFNTNSADASAHRTAATQICFADDYCLTVEVMRTDAERARGLQHRTSLPADHGMLFVFPSEKILSFWMKDTYIPLDMIWINDSGKIVDIKENVPPCKADPCPVYASSVKARYVFEANAHFAQEHGIKVGDEVVIK